MRSAIGFTLSPGPLTETTWSGFQLMSTEKMREIQESSRTVDTVKVAVMAALNIADELFQQREQAERVDAAIADKSSRCSEMLDPFLPE